jgi:exosortase A
MVAGAALLVGLGAFALILHPEIVAALAVWNDSDAFSHCYLVLPVALYLAWDRRDIAMATPLHPNPALAILTIPVAALWFVADRLGIMEARQLLAVTLLQIMVASICGWRMWRALSAPLLYLFFLVPFGEFLIPPLQTPAVHFTTTGLDLLGIPNFADDVTIQIPEGTFLVHQACSGFRFLIALTAFSALFACLVYTRPLRRLLFIAASFVIAVIGNDLRVLGIILIAHFIGNNQAIATDHVLWGWAFYVIIGAVLVLIGLLFRHDRSAQVRVVGRTSGRTSGPTVIALSSVVLLAAVPRVAANHLAQVETDAASIAQISAAVLPGCDTLPPSAAPPAPAADDKSAGISQSMAYRCDGSLFVLTLHRYPPRIASRTLFMSLRAAESPPEADIIRQADGVRAAGGSQGRAWRISESQKDGRYFVVATALWLDGRPAGFGIAARLEQGLNTLRRAPVSPVLAVITQSSRESLDGARRAVAHFLGKAAPVSGLVDKFGAAPATAPGG